MTDMNQTAENIQRKHIEKYVSESCMGKNRTDYCFRVKCHAQQRETDIADKKQSIYDNKGIKHIVAVRKEGISLRLFILHVVTVK